jgi:hypothetical protein
MGDNVALAGAGESAKTSLPAAKAGAARSAAIGVQTRHNDRKDIC